MASKPGRGRPRKPIAKPMYVQLLDRQVGPFRRLARAGHGGSYAAAFREAVDMWLAAKGHTPDGRK